MIKEFLNKQCELVFLPLSMLKECLPAVLTHITKIVNLSHSLGDLSDNLKMAIIRPLLKNLGLEPVLKNYRPVSNLSFLSKLMEKIPVVAKQFVDHLTKIILWIHYSQPIGNITVQKQFFFIGPEQHSN